jgi:hypothetical protein
MTQEAIDDVLQLVAIADRSIDDRLRSKPSTESNNNAMPAKGEYAQAPDVEVQGMPVLSEMGIPVWVVYGTNGSRLEISISEGMLLAGGRHG